MSDLLDRAGIAALIPHSGTMCLLEAVEQWDPESIRCRSNSHRDPENPLRHAGRLGALSLVEYGAQASAVHGGLIGGARPGRLVSVRKLELACETVDTLETVLTVTARRLFVNPEGMLYDFEVHAAARRLAQGRIAVMLV